MRDFPIRVFIIAGVIPHVVFSVLSVLVNKWLVIDHLPTEAKNLFWNQVVAVNSLAYGLGVGLGVYFVWPVIKAVRGFGQKTPPARENLPGLRRRSLLIGDYVTWLGFGLWLISGFVFPAWLRAAGYYDPQKTNDYLYFSLSQVICGLIASTQTFFMLTFLAVRGFHPMLVQTDQIDLDEISRLVRLDRRVYWYLGLAIVAPFLAIIVFGLIDLPGAGSKWATVGLAVIGILSVVLISFLLKAIRGDIAALLAAADPERKAPQSGLGTLDSFWISSR